MAVRLSNDELATRVRRRTARNSTTYRERLSQSGKTQTLVWLPNNIRQQLDAMANQQQQSLSAVTTALLSAALSPSPPAPASSLSVDTLPLFDPAPVGRDQQIADLHRQGLSNYAIADQVGCSEATVRRALKRLQEVTG
ncbi:MAG TPA: helix-turn-helix domain-containing protein [Candidatus Competibacteraceae bacterium]|nr:helix-turn-helix domain-containing protein [Candidatus Competibacteraceae bacterium]HRZ05373.1 helix-turn-helix domain-containing protein [Candidatus Competibacteraceae bacterium]HSA48304.1 helix-turn-helix domain-containing protein [Candidatus Competibacteraceae bacterium]